MSREIKFRAWSNEHNRYCDFVTLDENGRWVGWIKSNGVYLTTADIVLEQDTGIEDKNGKRICEGDIITETYSASKDGLYKENGEYKVEDYWVVKYNVKRAGFSPFCDCSTNGEYLYEEYIPKNYVEVEVVGNIHENPELLEH